MLHGTIRRALAVLNSIFVKADMQRKPLGTDHWQPWNPGCWGINDSGSPFYEFPGPTPGSWGINDHSTGCILGMINGLHLEMPRRKLMTP
jgi:hypothetical protein